MRRLLPSPFVSRLALMGATALYALSVYFAYVVYLHPQWEYMGFTYRPPGAVEFVALVLMIGGVAAVLPARLTHASAIVLMFLHCFVYVPGMVVTFCLDANRLTQYMPLALALFTVFVIASAVSRRGAATSRRIAITPGRKFVGAFLVAWLILCAMLVREYRDVMTFVAFDDVYEQRAAGASSGAVIAYAQTYFSNVITPALIALGLVSRRPSLLSIGIVGCIITYMINAQKAMFFLPLAMIAINAQLSSRIALLRTMAFPVLILAVVTFYAASQWETSVVAGVLALFFVHRAIAIPGLTLSQYFDQFSTEAFTYWSHVKGIDLLVPAPAQYASDPLWPGLGYMMGDRLFGNAAFNMNANLFSGDGLAAAGTIGVLVIGAVFAGFLWLLDSASRHWDRNFVMLAVLPVAMTLTNGHFFTTLFSFGGVFWLVVFALSRGHSRHKLTLVPSETSKARQGP
jgi:hypothetical protein